MSPTSGLDKRTKMKTKVFHRIIMISMIAVSAYGIRPLAKESGLSGSRPNIILVMTDDQGYGDLACHGHPFLKTPNIDRLYTQSTRFVDFHVSPTCAPTRSALMSGRAPFKTGITHTILERDRMALSSTTIAQVLKSAGYTTGIFGKGHLGDEDAYQPHNRGFDEAFIHGAGGIGQNYPGTQGDAPGTSYFNPVIKHNNSFVQTTGYCTDVFFRQAMVWIKQQGDKPFFAYLATNAPHGPYHVDKKYSDLYTDKCKNKQAAFLGMITNIDENLGILMQKLDEWGLTENTLLIFMTDNGSAAGSGIYNAGMKGGKGSVNEGGARVPLFMRLPGRTKAGVDVDRLTRHYDMFPTLAEIAGAKIPAKVELDGRSLVSLINNPQAKWDKRYTCFHKGRWNKNGAPGRWGTGDCNPDSYKLKNFAVRSEKWRLVGTESLYNIDKDPGEQTNVIAANPEVATEMLKAYEAWWKEVRPLMVNEDAPLDTGKPFVEQFKKQKSANGIPEWMPPEI
jgi:arylsulfatase A-like enzyme